MPREKRKPAQLTVQERVEELREKRVKKNRRAERLEETGWEEVDLSTGSWELNTVEPEYAFTLLDFTNRSKKVDIFLRLMPPTFIQEIIDHTHQTHQSASSYPCGRHFNITLSRFYKFLAIKIRIQGLQVVPTKNKPNANARRRAFQDAQQHFVQKYPNSQPPGINQLEKLHTTYLITPELESSLSKCFLSAVTSLGQHVAGDEKLFHFTGNSAYIRLVPNKPDRIGLWSYELSAELTNGAAFLLHVRSHTVNKAVGEKIPTSEVVSQWATVVQDKGQPETVLVADSYYLDKTGRALLTDMEIPFICSIKEDRFSQLADMVKNKVEKPGEWAAVWNDDQEELFVYTWDTNKEVGKKFTLTNAFSKKAKRSRKGTIPAYDHYKVMFSTCDHFNRGLGDCTWPHRHGGGNAEGDLSCLSDFYFSSILQNVKTAWSVYHTEPSDFKTLCTQLADELYAHACSLKD